MQDVELLRPGERAQHGHVQRVGVAHRAVEAQRLGPHRFQGRRGLRIAAREQRDVVASATSSSVSQEMTRSVPP